MKRKPIRVHHGNLEKHGVVPEEVFECFLTIRDQFIKKARKDVWQMIAQTAAGRYLEVLYENRPEEIWVFHAMDAKRHQIRMLKRKRKR